MIPHCSFDLHLTSVFKMSFAVGTESRKGTLDYGKYVEHECYQPVPLWGFRSNGWPPEGPSPLS